MSKNVAVDNLIDGMILAEPLTNSFGQTLMPAGTIIKSNHIKILKTWNIRIIKIKSDENESEVKISPEIIKIAQDKLIARMHWKPTEEEEKQLFKIGVFQAALNLMDSKKI